MPKDKYFLPLESSLFVRRGVEKIKDVDANVILHR